MAATIGTLVKLDTMVARDVKCLISSLYKINKEHHIFLEMKNKHPELNDAEYIVYPNFNSLQVTRFLDKEGLELFQSTEGVSEFILLPCDFEVKQYNIDIKNPYVMETNHVSTKGTFGWH